MEACCSKSAEFTTSMKKTTEVGNIQDNKDKEMSRTLLLQIDCKRMALVSFARESRQQGRGPHGRVVGGFCKQLSSGNWARPALVVCQQK